MLVGLLGGCGGQASPPRQQSSPPGAELPGGGSPSRAGASSTTTSTTSTTAAPATAPVSTTLPKEEPGWSVVAASPSQILVDTTAVTTSTGSSVTLVRFRAGTYRLDLHLGGTDPPSGGTPVPAVEGNRISSSERPALIAAFNGGFKSNTGAGGFEVDGRVVLPLVTGDASLVIDTDGAVRIGAWGQSVPAPGEQVWSVRQNLRPLISAGRPSPLIGEVAQWGATLHNLPRIARSAVGLDGSGDLVYAASMSCLPADLAQALGRAGVIDAMELDINPYWVQADVASYPGGPLRPAIPGQQRPSDQYLVGWTRDFFAVLAAG